MRSDDRSCASASPTRPSTATTTPAKRRDPDAAADAAQPRRPVRRRLAHRRRRRLPARPARGRLRQHHPRLHRRRAARRAARARSRARSRPRTPTASCAARSSAFRRASILRETPLTAARRRRSRDFADDVRARGRRRRARRCCTRCSTRLHERDDVRRRPDPCRRRRRPRPSRSSAASARTSPTSSSPRARSLGIPARYVGGYFRRADGVTEQEAGHAWAEAYRRRISAGSASIPPTASAPTDAHVRVAVGLDYLGAAPVRGTPLRRRRRDAGRRRSRSIRRAGRRRSQSHDALRCAAASQSPL